MQSGILHHNIYDVFNMFDTMVLQANICRFRQLTPSRTSYRELSEGLKAAIPITFLAHKKLNNSEFFRIREYENDTLFEYLYKITNLIKDMFDKDGKEQAFLYSSINDYRNKNCAVKSDIAKSLLKCTSGIYGKFLSYADNGETVTIKQYKTFSVNNNIFEYETKDMERDITMIWPDP